MTSLSVCAQVERRARFLLEAQRFQWLPRRQHELRTQAKLTRILERAWGIAFYRDAWSAAGITHGGQLAEPSALSRLSLLTKPELREQLSNDPAIRALPTSDGVVRSTSGTNGQPVRVFTPSAAYDYYLAAQYRTVMMAGARPWHTVAYVKCRPDAFGPRNTAAASSSYLGLFRTEFLPVDLSEGALMERLERLRPQILYGYPSKMLSLASEIEPERLRRLGLRGIVVNSEGSTVEQRRHMAHAFGSAVHDEYGAHEVLLMASTCERGLYHVASDCVIIETLRDDGTSCRSGERGRVVVTSLLNDAMPIVRYDIGDQAARSDEPCRCGRTTPVMTTIDGRDFGEFLLPGGRRIRTMEVNRTVLETPGVTDLGAYQVVQETPEKVQLIVMRGGESRRRAAELVIMRVHHLLDASTRVSVRYVETMPRSGDGRKLMAVRSMVQNGGSAP